MNIFEGARRVALTAAVLWIVGWIAATTFQTPYARLTYAVAWPGSAPFRVEECGDNDATQYTDAKARGGDTVHVTLCFSAQKSDSGELLVPYAGAAGGRYRMAAKYALEVTRYANEAAHGFQLPPKGLQDAERLLSEARQQQWEVAIRWLFGGLAVGWAFVAGIGWIARGFAGIPKGQDSRIGL